MTAAGQDGVWTGPQLAAHLAALGGEAPAPAVHVLYRVTLHDDGSEACTYTVPGEAKPLEPGDWPRWLRRRGLIGPDQLRVHVQLIRETLEASGQIMECVLERRLGSVDGPFQGFPARIEFVGPAQRVRWYRAEPHGQLLAVPLTISALPAAHEAAEHLAGEIRVLEEQFGPGLQLLDSRDPTLFEDAVGLSSVVHLRLQSGAELACGIGWFGTTGFVLVAAFPRFDAPLSLAPPEDAAIAEALNRLGLIRYEVRLDDSGLAVMARRHGEETLFLLRSTDGSVTAEPYEPAAIELGTADQRRWLRYVESHEGLTPLDHYVHASSDDIVVLSGDAGGHVWRHLVDADGVETWRRPADDTAIATLHRERLNPGTLAQLDGELPAGDPGRPKSRLMEAPPPPDTLLAKAQAYQSAMEILHAARDIALVSQAETQFPADLVAQLRGLQPNLEALSAEHAANQLGALLAEVEIGIPNLDRLVRDLSRLEAGLHDELALIRLVSLQPAQWRRLNQAAPFGVEVEAGFPGCTYDIEEAASCLAFRRPTAAVFHCMKVMERGLLALGRLIGLTDFPGAMRGWGEVLQAVRPACPHACVAVVTQLERLRRRWHAAGLHPAEKYTEAEAEAVFQALGAFMRELVRQCDETGAAGVEAPPIPIGRRGRQPTGADPV